MREDERKDRDIGNGLGFHLQTKSHVIPLQFSKVILFGLQTFEVD